MSPHAWSENQLVEQPAIGLFAALGWQTVSALDETFGAGGTLGRETRGEVVLVERLRAALGKFNPTLPPEAIANAVDALPVMEPDMTNFAALIQGSVGGATGASQSQVDALQAKVDAMPALAVVTDPAQAPAGSIAVVAIP